MGHGEGARCGQQYYDEIYQCGSCAKKELKRLQSIVTVATMIAAEVDRSEAERGRPYKETYVHPSTGKTEDNALTINMRLLNQLRKAVKELK
jgi:hypothetical protein